MNNKYKISKEIEECKEKTASFLKIYIFKKNSFKIIIIQIINKKIEIILTIIIIRLN